MTELRWEPFGGPKSWAAKCGEGTVALVTERIDGKFAWQITAVQMGWVGNGFGEASQSSTAKKAVERNWRRWLEHYGIICHV
ncbi:hypothetical protein EV129_113113 [Rhizobium azibense]|uniref:Uncharacterized protein n=1 Tax=Rhizobium azibense TaxID=1136135 RepID=A0A4R3RIB4_9HYPH|nr:hypothetical protein EV129_113113 [Rhizobium azibense]